MNLAPLQIEPARAALIAGNLQKGVMARAAAPYSSAIVLTRVIALAQAMRAAGGFTVAAVSVWGEQNAPPRQVDRAPPADARSAPADWADLPEQLAPWIDQISPKPSWGAFANPALEDALRERGVDTLILAGLAAPFGLESTARQAWELGYRLITAEDAITGPSAATTAHTRTEILPRIGQVRATEAIIAALQA